MMSYLYSILLFYKIPENLLKKSLTIYPHTKLGTASFNYDKFSHSSISS